MAGKALIVVTRDTNLDQHLVALPVGTTRAGIPLLNGDGALAARAHHVEQGAVRKERRGAVCRGGSVAHVSTDGARDAQLRATRRVAGLAQRGNRSLDDGARSDVVEPRDGANLDRAVVGQGHAIQLVVQVVNRDQVCARKLAAAHLYEHVGTASNDDGLGVLGQGTAGVLDARGLVQGFNVVHQISPSLLKPSTRRCGVMGM